MNNEEQESKLTLEKAQGDPHVREDFEYLTWSYDNRGCNLEEYRDVFVGYVKVRKRVPLFLEYPNNLTFYHSRPLTTKGD